MNKYIIALLSPGGRINRYGFIVLYLPVLGALAWLHSILCTVTGDDYHVWRLAAYFALLWSQYCLVSRRFQDNGISGLLFLPIYIVIAGAFLAEIDPSIPNSFGDEQTWLGYADMTRDIAKGVFGAMWIYFLISSGESDYNGYGAPFDHVTSRKLEIDPELVRRMKEGGSRHNSLQDYGRSPQDIANTPKLGFNKPSRKSGFGQR